MPKILDHSVRVDVISLAGELDLATAPELRSRLTSAASMSTAALIVLDMSQVNFLDAHCASIIMAAGEAARQRGARLRVDRLHGIPKVVFDLLGLESSMEGSG